MMFLARYTLSSSGQGQDLLLFDQYRIKIIICLGELDANLAKEPRYERLSHIPN